MYILKNALKNISRSKGRNILIGIIVLVIATSSCVALSIKESAKTAEDEAVKSLNITATIGIDRQSIMKNAQTSGTDMKATMQGFTSLTLDEMQKYAASTYVSDFNYYTSSSVSKSDSFEPVKTTTDSVQAVNPDTNSTASDNTNQNEKKNSMSNNQEQAATPGKGFSVSELAKFESFKTDVKTMGLSDNYTVSSTDATTYEQSLVPIQNLSKFADLFLILVLSIGGVILVVLNIFNIRERKYEVGVLTAIGMKKGKVAFQYITELFIVTIIAIVLGTGIGAAASVPTANALLENQISAQATQASTQDQNFGRSGQGQSGRQLTSSGTKSKVVNYIDDINASTDINVLIKLIGIGIILTIISSCGSVIFILRYEPLKILSNRS